jgi:hypothetical protein
MSWLQLWTPLGTLAAWGQRAENLLARRWAPWLMLVTLAGLYVQQYLGHTSRPREGRPGWWSWQDQSYYRWTSEAVTQLSTEPGLYKVSLGYPLTAVPFRAIMPEHLFFLPNLAMTLGIAVLFYRIARLFLSRRDTVVMMLIVLAWTKFELVTALVIPWTTIPTHFLAYLMVYLYLTREPGWRLVLALTLLDGSAYLCRPGDGAFLAPIVAIAVVQIPGSWKRRMGVAGVGVAIVLGFVLLDRLFNMAVFDRALSSYERGALDDFFGFSVAQRVYGLLVDGMPIHRVQDKLIIERLGYLLFVGPGLWFMARRLRWKFIAPAASVAACIALYLSYNYFRPFNLYRYHLVHYVTWLFPLGGLAAYVTVRRAWETVTPRTFALLLGIPLALFSFLRLEEQHGPLAWVAADGRLTSATDEWDAEATYDLIVGRRATGRRPNPQHTGLKIESFDDGNSTVAHIAEPVPVGEIVFEDPRDFGATVELRRLTWGFELLPAPLEKRIGNARVTAPRARGPLFETTVGWEKLKTDVGIRDFDRAGLKTTGKPGVLQRGPHESRDSGHYVIEWFGTVERGGKIVVEVTKNEGTTTLVRKSLDVSTGQEMLLATLDLRLAMRTDGLEYRFLIVDDVELELRRLAVWQHADWIAYRGAE